MHKLELQNRLRDFLSVAGNRRLTLLLTATIAVCVVAPAYGAWADAKSRRVQASDQNFRLQELRNDVQRLQRQQEALIKQVVQLRMNSVGPDQIEALRQEITDIVRLADCRLRNLAITDQSQRRWMEDDHVDSDGFASLHAEFEPIPTDFSLQIQPLELVVTGEFGKIRKLLQTIHQLPQFCQTQSIDIQGSADAEIRVQWEMSLYSLLHNPAPEDDWAE